VKKYETNYSCTKGSSKKSNQKRGKKETEYWAKVISLQRCFIYGFHDGDHQYMPSNQPNNKYNKQNENEIELE